MNPKVLLADEPISMLDVSVRLGVLNLLRGLCDNEKLAVLYITHDIASARYIADETIVMYAGQVVERAPAGALYAAPRHPYTLGLLNSSPPLHGERVELEGIPGSPPDLTDMAKGCSFHPRCPYAMEKCASTAPPLRPIDETGRVVACWLHAGDENVRVPGPLRRFAPPAAAPRRPGSSPDISSGEAT